jgi:hypothetical protein
VTAPRYDIDAHTEFARHDHNLRYHASDYVRPADQSQGRCTWRHHWEDSTILCWSYDVPGTGACPHHLAQRPDIVTFPAVTVVIADASGVAE